uniref:TF-B3 domain-containing protein n=1 Tax=Oryza barthii TaxID=65489 RepID=A0A0D3FUZ8_9ORYZ
MQCRGASRASAEVGHRVEDLWEVAEPQLSPSEKLNSCFEDIAVASFHRPLGSQECLDDVWGQETNLGHAGHYSIWKNGNHSRCDMYDVKPKFVSIGSVGSAFSGTRVIIDKGARDATVALRWGGARGRRQRRERERESVGGTTRRDRRPRRLGLGVVRPVPITLATAYKMQHGDKLKLQISHDLKIKIKIREAAGTLYMTTGWKQFIYATGLRIGETVLFRMSSCSKARVMVLNRKGFIRCPIRTTSKSSSVQKKSLPATNQAIKTRTFQHGSTNNSRTGTNKRALDDMSFCHKTTLTAELRSYIKDIAYSLEESNKFYIVRMNRMFMEQNRVYFAKEFSKKYI